ncbi:MAG TPA: Crp/Fnr family transcriptional regulator [Burkholderiales bacterium]|nr:Crp/Fnr family transcriptional regulator [Burkholderiales bacterium]
MPAVAPSRSANHLLAALPLGSYRRMSRALEPVSLEFGQIICEPGDALRHVYFPLDCLISLLAAVNGGEDDLEVGLVGREGLAGMPLALGNRTSPVRELVQGAGSALRMPAKRFVEELARAPNLRRLIDRCVFVAMSTAMQIAACNKSHVLEARLARWLLMVRDRLGRNEFYLTQDFLARMLGVRRAGVNEAAGALQQRKLIDYRRGNVRLLDAPGLRPVACSCYEVIRKLENGG